MRLHVWCVSALLLGLVSGCHNGSAVAPSGSDVLRSSDSGLGVPDVLSDDRKEPWSPDVASPQLAVVETWLDEETLVAGSGLVVVTCMGYDDAGNHVGVGPCHLVTDPPLVVSGMTVTGTIAGLYDVVCVPDVALDVTLEGARLGVLPGPPESIDITPYPDKSVYLQGHSLVLTATGQDTYGNVLDEVGLDGISVLPASLAKVVQGKVTFLAEGSGTISAHAAGVPSASDSINILVDGGAPVIVIDSPDRGEQLLGPGPVTVLGRVSDATGLATATLNGEALTLDSKGHFSTTVPGAFGINLLVVEAEDTLGNHARHVQSYALASAYAPVVDGDVEDLYVPGGIKAWVDYVAFKGDGSQGVTLSQVGQSLLAAMDLAALIPSPVAQQEILLCTYDVILDNLTHGPPTIELWPVAEGLTVHVKFPALAATLSLPAAWCPDVSGEVTASAVTLTALVAVDIDAKGEVMVEMTSVEVQFVNLALDLEGVTGALLEALLIFFEDDLTAMVEAQFEEQVKAQVEAWVADTLGVIAVDQWIDLPPFMPSAPSTPAEVHFRGSALSTAYGGMEVAMDAAFTTVDKKHLELRGAPLRMGCMTGPAAVPTVTTQHYMEVAIHDDVLAQSVFTKFLSGGIDFVMDQESLSAMGNDFAAFGVEDLSIVANAFLPPVMTDCGPDKALRIQLGELRLKISLSMLGMPLEMTLYLYFSAKADFKVLGDPGAQQVQFTFGELDFVDYHIEEINEEWQGNEALFGELIEETFLAEFVTMIQAYPYTIDVTEMAIGDLLPAFSGWTLVPVIDTIQRQPGALLVKAHLLLEE